MKVVVKAATQESLCHPVWACQHEDMSRACHLVTVSATVPPEQIRKGPLVPQKKARVVTLMFCLPIS